MLEVVRQTVATALFAEAKQPVAFLEKTSADAWQAVLPTNCQTHPAPDGATYVDALQTLLTQEQPRHLLLLPPLIPAEKLPKTLQKHYPRLGLHEIALQIALAQTPAACLIGVWLPHGFFVNLSSQTLRETINTTHTPRFIVDYDFPVNITPVVSTIKMHLLVVQSGKAPDNLVRFFRWPALPVETNVDGPQLYDEARQRAMIKDLQRVAKQGGGATEFGYVLRNGIPAQTPWLFDRHHPRYQQHIEDLGHFGGVRPLGELVEIQLGFHTSEQVNLLLPGRETNQGIPVIEGRDIGSDNVLHWQESRYRALPDKTQPYQLQVGDICLRALLGSDQKLHAVQIESTMLPLVANNTVMILRPKPEVNIDSDFLTAYLQSAHVVQVLKAQGIAQRLYTQALAEVPVPIQDEEVRTALQELRTAAHTLHEWRAEAEAAIRSLFDFESTKDARTHLLATGRRVRQRKRAAGQIDELSYRLRVGLPHPLAYRWRVAETAQSNLEGYRDVLECAETSACYLALVALIMMRSIAAPIGHLVEMADRLTNRGHGTNFGDWVTILREVRDRKQLRQLANVPFYEVARFLDDPTIDKALTRLTQQRNDDAHGRGPRGTEIPIKVSESLAALQTFLEAVEFLSEYPLRYVEETHRDSITGITRYRYREIMGDHVVVPVLEAETTAAEVEAHSLYLIDRKGELHLVRPFLTRKECPACGRWEIFFLDRFDQRQRTCTLKSMEKGHTMLDDKIAPVFQHVCLLA